MNELLSECRRIFGEGPRNFSLWEQWTYLHTMRPSWCTSRDELSVFFQGRRELLRSGVVVWGRIVMANQLLFQPGALNCPAEVVFTLEPEFEDMLNYLSEVSQAVFKLKGTSPEDPELNRIATHLTNEMTRVFGMEVPASLSPSARCMLSTIFVDRKHIPKRYLSSLWFPLLVSPNPPHIAMILPHKYWHTALKR